MSTIAGFRSMRIPPMETRPAMESKSPRRKPETVTPAEPGEPAVIEKLDVFGEVCRELKTISGLVKDLPNPHRRHGSGQAILTAADRLKAEVALLLTGEASA